jgi:hypothetical protein
VLKGVKRKATCKIYQVPMNTAHGWSEMKVTQIILGAIITTAFIFVHVDVGIWAQ